MKTDSGKELRQLAADPANLLFRANAARLKTENWAFLGIEHRAAQIIAECERIEQTDKL